MTTPRTVVAFLVVAVAMGTQACTEDIDPELALRSGIASQQEGDLEAAAEQYRAVLDVRPNDEDANYRLAAIEGSARRVALAERYLRAALDADPTFVAALFDLAALRAELGATQEAIDLYERVVAIQPEHARAHLRLGVLYRDAGEIDVAISHLETAVVLDPALDEEIPTAP